MTSSGAPADPRAAVFEPERAGRGRPRYLAFHLFALLLLGSVWLVYARSPGMYDRLMQEDQLVEWAAAIFFGLAAILRGRKAIVSRRFFDGLVALFCLFVAGEEISWGQRMLGYTPPAWFLEHNTQQETNLHNFANIIGRPKWTLMLVLAAYALLGIAAQSRAVRRVIEKVGASAPPLELVPWLATAVALLFWYPVSFTGEWAELLAGSIFYAGAVGNVTFALSAVGVMLAAQLLTVLSARRTGGPEALACAKAETQALAEDLAGGAAMPRLLNADDVDKRVWTAAHSDYLNLSRLTRFRTAACALPGNEKRREFAVDPWGIAYWLAAWETNDSTLVARVYSFGPNRRVDEAESDAEQDDVGYTVVLSVRRGR